MSVGLTVAQRTSGQPRERTDAPTGGVTYIWVAAEPDGQAMAVITFQPVPAWIRPLNAPVEVPR